jgi:hypothetical protein
MLLTRREAKNAQYQNRHPAERRPGRFRHLSLPKVRLYRAPQAGRALHLPLVSKVRSRHARRALRVGHNGGWAG